MKAFIPCGVAGLFMALVLLTGTPWSNAHESSFAPEDKILFTKHFQNSLFDITEHADYSVEILLDDKEYKIGKNSVGIVLHNARDEDVRGAEIIFIVRDLASGKSSTVTPRITDKGNGLYIISGLDLMKEGRRELVISVKKGTIEDRLKFILPDALKTLLPKGRYSP